MTDTETARKGKLLEDYAKAVSDEIRSSLRDAVKLRLESTSAAKIHPSEAASVRLLGLVLCNMCVIRSYCTRPGLMIVHCPPKLVQTCSILSKLVRERWYRCDRFSPTNFSELAKFHKSIDWPRIALQCDEKICDKVEHQFGETWEQFNMVTKIAVLELLKKRTKNKDIAQW